MADSTTPVTLKWLDALQFVGIDTDGNAIMLSSPGEGREGAKPSDLLPLSLAGCSSVDVVSILKKKRQNLTGLEVHVIAPQDTEPPWAFQSFHLHYIVRGEGINTKAVEDAIRLSEGKYCSVAATLRKGVPVTWDFEIVETEFQPELAL